MLRAFLITVLLAAAPLLTAQEDRPLSCDDAKLEEALADLKKEAEENGGSPRAVRQIYMRYDYAGHRPQAEAWAQKFISMLTDKSAEGNSKAMMNLAHLYLQGDPVVPADADKAMMWLKSAEAAEDSAACIMLAGIYNSQNKPDEAAKAYRHAFAIYEKRAAEGNTAGKLRMADMLFQGLGVQRDADRAVKIYEELAEKDDPTAITELFRIYAMAPDGLPKALGYARRLADAGDAKMAYLMYCELMRGTTLERDEAAAAKYLEAAIKEPRPYPEALYQKGWDAEAAGDVQAAIPFYERAITMGHDRARTCLALILMNGAQGDAGKERGLKLLEESAIQHNSPYSAYELALYYKQAGDSAQSDEWYIKASERGYAPAMGRRGLLHLNPFSPVEWSPTLAYRWWKQGERAQDPTCTRYINTYLYVFTPLLVVLVCTLPLLLIKIQAKRKARKARS
ncbi:MAG: sel1 repeat family protein [Akkermansia sp.]|nr:sel1 repeat family protein [Akkermansia sp.]